MKLQPAQQDGQTGPSAYRHYARPPSPRPSCVDRVGKAAHVLFRQDHGTDGAVQAVYRHHDERHGGGNQQDALEVGGQEVRERVSE